MSSGHFHHLHARKPATTRAAHTRMKCLTEGIAQCAPTIVGPRPHGPCSPTKRYVGQHGLRGLGRPTILSKGFSSTNEDFGKKNFYYSSGCSALQGQYPHPDPKTPASAAGFSRFAETNSFSNSGGHASAFENGWASRRSSQILSPDAASSFHAREEASSPCTCAPVGEAGYPSRHVHAHEDT